MDCSVPTIAELRPHVFQVRVAHVLDAEHPQRIVLLDAFLDVGVQPPSQLFALLVRLRQVDDPLALGPRHFLIFGSDWGAIRSHGGVLMRAAFAAINVVRAQV